ncbi:MAG: hypothetical protein H5U24_19790 [Thioclava marina]|jgi:hypothetical protein|uniref:hypothetical protein n=1 Tax=Thioclava marina TaxID=1915077 RepID=UPI001995C69B|nr:hypothetical protein [Thioclava marina]MBC7147609.1 hypothetical protein [Thioclava marina]
MTDFSRITLAGGIKAAAPAFRHSPSVSPQPSPAHAAFAKMNEALANALDTTLFNANSASWDPAYVASDEDAAFGALLETARAAGDTRIVLASDRRLVFAARFISATLRLIDEGIRLDMLHFMSVNQPLLSPAEPGPTAQRADRLIAQTYDRLEALMNAVANDGAANDAFTPGAPTF